MTAAHHRVRTRPAGGLACWGPETSPREVGVRLSQFWALMDQEFGSAYARSLARTHALHAFGDRTAEEAIEAGVPVRSVWEALCDDFDVPPERRHLAEPPEKRR